MLAKSGLGSRRACELLIVEGRVKVNGAPARLGQRADGAHDRVEVDGVPLPGREGLAYYLLNKPVGVVCTASDPQGRQTVLDLSPRRFWCTWRSERLDISSEGLIVLTNDGELAFQLTHPSFGVMKEYVVEVEGKLSKEAGRAAAPRRPAGRRFDWLWRKALSAHAELRPALIRGGPQLFINSVIRTQLDGLSLRPQGMRGEGHHGIGIPKTAGITSGMNRHLFQQH